MSLPTSVVLYLMIIVSLFVMLIWTKVRPAMLFFSALMLCYLFGFINSSSLLNNVSNIGLATLVLLLLCSLALEKTVFLHKLSTKLVSRSLPLSMLKITTAAATCSAFLNNTVVVASLVGALTRNKYHAPSKLLLPLSYAAILGGTTTLIGTSTNLIVSSFTQQYADFSLTMFSFLPIGVAVSALGIILLLISVRFLPNYLLYNKNYNEYLVEARLAPNSPLIGLSVEKNGLRNLNNLFLVEIIRNEQLISPVTPQTILKAHDTLIFSGDINDVSVLQQFKGLTLFAHAGDLLKTNLQEVIVSHTAPLLGKTLKEAGFRAKFDAAVVAIHRNGQALSGKLGNITIAAGDRLILAVGSDFSHRNNLTKNFYFVTEHTLKKSFSTKQEFAVLAIFACVISLAIANIISLFEGLLFALLGLLACNLLDANEVKRRFPFELTTIIICALGLANAFTGSGSEQLLTALLHHTELTSPFIALIIIYLLTLVTTELITNNAAAALMFPLAYGIASSLQVDILPFALAVAYGASAAFISPYSYQTNTLVMNAGGYQFKDFIRIGSPLSILYSLIVLTMLYWLFPF